VTLDPDLPAAVRRLPLCEGGWGDLRGRARKLSPQRAQRPQRKFALGLARLPKGRGLL